MWVKIVSVFLFLFAGQLLMSPPATAKPIEVKSENFIFVGDTSEKNAVRLVEGLEAYRAILSNLYNLNPGPEIIPVRIYGFKTISRLHTITGNQNIGGVYTTRLDGPVFLLSSEGGFREGSPAWRTAFHEYTHHVLATFTYKHYPTWYNEGYADFLSTFTYDKKKKRFEVGLPGNRGYALEYFNWLPFDYILGAVHGYPFANLKGNDLEQTSAMFYAQSWMAAHLIQSTPELLPKIDTYLELLNSPNTPENAFETAMQMSADEFGKQVRDYFDKGRVRYLRGKLDVQVEIPEISVRKLTKAELKYYYGESLRRMYSSDESRQLALDYFVEAEEDLGRTEELLISRSLMSLSDKDYLTALSLAEEALKTAPNSRHAMRSLGIVQLKAYKALGSKTASFKDARRNLKQAMIAFPDDAQAHYYYARTFQHGSEKPSKQAIASALGALGYYRDMNFLASNMHMAKMLIGSEEEEVAKQVYTRVLIWADDPKMREHAERQLARIDRE